ncbi:MAG: cysS [Candidatus Saccharibacteria bacterium]|nr:cysS [Candidatus Saccharibacteria bacterium]
MKLYNTLTKQIDDFQPLEAGKAKVYTCGPTVYDYAHIGHWFNYVRMDTLIRTLKSASLETNWVMNITDVGHLVSDADEGEDKLEKGAKREGKTAWEVAEFYTKDFLECMQLLSMLTPDHIVKATDHIEEQIGLIKRLEEKGFTYVIDDGVYYDTSKFEGYAAFARLDLDNQEAGARVGFNEQKLNTSDFALWKFSPTDHQRDMEWESPWGKGFPGWHIECSAMAMKYLGDELDIHTGGIDHIAVHHTNEIAQSEAATGKRFAQIWLHSNHVTVNGEKISKSLGNGIRLQEIIEKGVPAEAVRLHILESSYRSQAKFSWESLEAAHNRLKHWKEVAALVWQPSTSNTIESVTAGIAMTTEEIRDELENDLNTPQVLSLVDRLLSVVEANLLSADSTPAFKDFLEFLNGTLGIDLMADGPISNEALAIFMERLEARNNKDWAKSDALRDQLTSLGYGLRDGANGVTWFRL